MQKASQRRARILGTVGAAGAHAYLSIIGFLGLLNYTVPTRYALIDEVAADQLWAWIHGGVVVLLLSCLYRDRDHKSVHEYPYAAFCCNVAFAVMFTWGFFNLLWGLTTVRPVSLAGPGLAFFVAAGEQLLANGWMRGLHDKGR